jgi:hypothetical protein
MKKMMILVLPLVILLISPVYAALPAQDCPDCVYELYEGTSQTLISGNLATNAKSTFLLNKLTGDVWMYSAEGTRWVLTNREKLAEKR